ncbi:MAG: hypothetical protein M1827_006393 [Pycnora praestabilis]|nr:MAG: hypothetical protein M1827_006393 [Pycnora praestabilis]
MENLPKDYFVTSMAFTKTTYRDQYPSIDPLSEALSQAGKVIVITGASKGIGRRGFVASFAKANPKGIVLVARKAAELSAAGKDVHAINPKIEVLEVPTDITNSESVSALWERVKTTFGHADVLINNAGSWVGEGLVGDVPPGKWWADFEMNVHGPFLVLHGFLQLLGTEREGSIVTMTSGVTTGIFPTTSSYTLSKLAIQHLQAFIAAEYPKVTATSLHPGVVMTDMTKDQWKPFAHDTPELVGSTGVWLATEKAKFLSGKYISANWSVDDLMARKDEIISEGKLSMGLKGEFGAEQFA